LDRFDEVSGRQLLSLIIYTAVILYSGVLAFYYLSIEEETGRGGQAESPATRMR